MDEEKYSDVTVQHYGNAADLYRQVSNDFAERVLHRLTHMEEHQRKEAEYWASPEGQAKREEQRLAYEKRERFAKKWQPLHDWLVKNGVECDHEYCG